MKVICVDNSPGRSNCAHRLLKEGDVYTASQCSIYPDSYDLSEVPINPMEGCRISFLKRRFIPCSDVDEQDPHEQHIEKLTADYVAKYGELPIVKLDPVALARNWQAIKSHLGW